MKVRISLIMPNYNGEKYLQRSIESFLLQEYENKELIIVDGKSTDNSHQIINKYCNNVYPIKWIKDVDKGISNAFNIGLSYVTGDIIGYTGSDDILYHNIFNHIDNSSKRFDFDAIYFDSYTYYIKDKRAILRECPRIPFTKESLLASATIVGWQNIYFKKSIYDHYRYDEDNKYCMDYEFYLRISEANYFFLYVPEVASINIFDGNISSDVDGKQKKEAFEVFKRYQGKYKGPSYFIHKKSNIIVRIIKKIQKLIYRGS